MEPLDIGEHLKCTLCREFLSDAVSLTSCLHYFCRSCLLQHISTTNSAAAQRCPKCLTKFGAEPIYRRDPKLQEQVYKTVPELFWRQLRRVARRRRRHLLAGGSPPSERREQQRKQLLQLSNQLCSPNEKISIQLDYIPLSAILAANEGESSEGKGNPSASTTVELKSSEKHNFRRFFLCPAKTRVESLKKLLQSKLAMTDMYGIYLLDPSLKNVLENECSLEDLVQMFKWTRQAPFQIHFTMARLLQEEEDRPPILEEMPQLDLENGLMEPSEQQQREDTTEAQKVADKNNQVKETREDGKIADASVTKTSSPNTVGSPLPRLSTAGVSPLCSVPSLVGTLSGSSTAPQPPTSSKKRKRNSSSATQNESESFKKQKHEESKRKPDGQLQSGQAAPIGSSGGSNSLKLPLSQEKVMQTQFPASQTTPVLAASDCDAPPILSPPIVPKTPPKPSSMLKRQRQPAQQKAAANQRSKQQFQHQQVSSSSSQAAISTMLPQQQFPSLPMMPQNPQAATFAFLASLFQGMNPQQMQAAAFGLAAMAGQQQKSMNPTQPKQQKSPNKNAANSKESKLANGSKNLGTTSRNNPTTSNTSGSHLTSSIDQQAPMVMPHPLLPNLMPTTLKATLPG